jgi:HEAT repeat protein
MLRRAIPLSSLLLFPVLSAGLLAQVQGIDSPDAKVRKKAVNELGEKGRKQEIDVQTACSSLGKLTRDAAPEVREDVVIGLIKIGSPYCLPGLVQMTKDASPEIQSLAVDGLVNLYVPGYVKFGWLNSVKSFSSSLKNRFREPEPIVVEPSVRVAPEAVDAITPLISGGSSMESRANAARAAGILRAQPAISELQKALQSRDETIILEAVRSIEKIGDLNAGSSLIPMLRDPNSKIRMAAAEAVGQLRVKESVEDLNTMVRGDRDKDVQRAALTAMAKIPDNGQDKVFLLYLRDKDDKLRAAAAEGLGRSGNPSDLKTVQEAFAIEKNESVRLSLAFAAVHLGDKNMITYLVDGLDSKFHRLEARPFLVELARDPQVLPELYTPLTSGTEQQKIELAYVVGRSGTRESEPHLERLSHDTNPKVAEAALRELSNLRARL